MKRISSVIAIMFFCSVFSAANASIIWYNLTGATDTEGYNLSGLVAINSDPNIMPGSYTGTIIYSIDYLLFASCTGLYAGNSGQIMLPYQMDTSEVLTSGGDIRFVGDIAYNSVGKENADHWGTAKTGLWFVGVEPTLEAYSQLPDQIQFYTYFMAEYAGTWGPSRCTPILERVTTPVPEPASILLLGSGLVGLAGFRKKLKS